LHPTAVRVARNRRRRCTQPTSQLHATAVAVARNRSRTGTQPQSDRHATAVGPARNRSRTGTQPQSQLHATAVRQARNRDRSSRGGQAPRTPRSCCCGFCFPPSHPSRGKLPRGKRRKPPLEDQLPRQFLTDAICGGSRRSLGRSRPRRKGTPPHHRFIASQRCCGGGTLGNQNGRSRGCIVAERSPGRLVQISVAVRPSLSGLGAIDPLARRNCPPAEPSEN